MYGGLFVVETVEDLCLGQFFLSIDVSEGVDVPATLIVAVGKRSAADARVEILDTLRSACQFFAKDGLAC